MNDTENSLFFMAKNLAIENTIMKIENFINKQNMKIKVSALWAEFSNGSPVIELKFPWKESEEHRNIHMTRSMDRFEELGDDQICVYKLQSITSDAYYRYRKPKDHQELDDFLAGKEFHAFVIDQIKACNYPFPHESYSPF